MGRGSYTGAGIGRAVAQGLTGFGASLQRIAQEDRERQAAEQSAATDESRFQQSHGLDRERLALQIQQVRAENDRAAAAAKNDARAKNDVNWSNLETPDGYVQVHPRSGEVRPLLQGGQPVTPPPRATPTPSTPNWQVVPSDQGLLQVNPQTGQSRPIQAPDGSNVSRTPPIPATAQQAIQNNQMRLVAIDRALAALDENPESVGGARSWVPDVIRQRMDPEGIEARASIADVGSMVILSRSGGAVSASEMERLRPFIPNNTDSPETVRSKLQRFREIAAEEQRLYEESFVRGGVGPDYQAQYPENPY